MEPRFEQLFILALFVGLALLDMLLRWARRKARPEEQELEEGEDERLLVAELETRRRGPAWTDHEVVAVPAPPRPRPSTVHVLPSRKSATPGPRRCGRTRHWLNNPNTARHGMILMTVLGPCRGMEPPQGQDG
jgi:hypothetical protein